MFWHPPIAAYLLFADKKKALLPKKLMCCHWTDDMRGAVLNPRPWPLDSASSVVNVQEVGDYGLRLVDGEGGGWADLVIARLQQVTHEAARDLQAETPGLQQPGRGLTQHEVGYDSHLLHTQCAEDDDLVQPIQELRPEVSL